MKCSRPTCAAGFLLCRCFEGWLRTVVMLFLFVPPPLSSEDIVPTHVKSGKVEKVEQMFQRYNKVAFLTVSFLDASSLTNQESY